MGLLRLQPLALSYHKHRSSSIVRLTERMLIIFEGDYSLCWFYFFKHFSVSCLTDRRAFKACQPRPCLYSSIDCCSWPVAPPPRLSARSYCQENETGSAFLHVSVFLSKMIVWLELSADRSPTGRGCYQFKLTAQLFTGFEVMMLACNNPTAALTVLSWISWKS